MINTWNTSRGLTRPLYLNPEFSANYVVNSTIFSSLSRYMKILRIGGYMTIKIYPFVIFKKHNIKKIHSILQLKVCKELFLNYVRQIRGRGGQEILTK